MKSNCYSDIQGELSDDETVVIHNKKITNASINNQPIMIESDTDSSTDSSSDSSVDDFPQEIELSIQNLLAKKANQLSTDDTAFEVTFASNSLRNDIIAAQPRFLVRVWMRKKVLGEKKFEHTHFRPFLSVFRHF